MTRFLYVIICALLFGLPFVSAAPPATRPAGAISPGQDLAAQIENVQRTLDGLPADSPDRADLALHLMQLKQSQRALSATSQPALPPLAERLCSLVSREAQLNEDIQRMKIVVANGRPVTAGRVMTSNDAIGTGISSGTVLNSKAVAQAKATEPLLNAKITEAANVHADLEAAKSEAAEKRGSLTAAETDAIRQRLSTMDKDRAALEGQLDSLLPSAAKGGNRSVVQNSQVPVIEQTLRVNEAQESALRLMLPDGGPSNGVNGQNPTGSSPASPHAAATDGKAPSETQQTIAKLLLAYVVADHDFDVHQKHFEELVREADQHLAAGDGDGADAVLKLAKQETAAQNDAIEREKVALESLKKYPAPAVNAARDILLSSPNIDAALRIPIQNFSTQNWATK